MDDQERLKTTRDTFEQAEQAIATARFPLHALVLVLSVAALWMLGRVPETRIASLLKNVAIGVLIVSATYAAVFGQKLWEARKPNLRYVPALLLVGGLLLLLYRYRGDVWH